MTAQTVRLPRPRRRPGASGRTDWRALESSQAATGGGELGLAGQGAGRRSAEAIARAGADLGALAATRG